MKKQLLLIVIAAFIFIFTSARYETPADSRIGYTAPGFSVEKDGNKVELQKLRGAYVLVSFWSSTDAESRIATIAYDRLARNHAEMEFVESTARSAEIVSNSDGSIACVGPSALAEIYDLDILFANCADVNNNSTRFVIIEKQPNRTVGKKDKTSIAFTLDNRPGALFEALGLLASSNINMLKIL